MDEWDELLERSRKDVEGYRGKLKAEGHPRELLPRRYCLRVGWLTYMQSSSVAPVMLNSRAYTVRVIPLTGDEGFLVHTVAHSINKQIHAFPLINIVVT
jgi:hypothetical protein